MDSLRTNRFLPEVFQFRQLVVLDCESFQYFKGHLPKIFIQSRVRDGPTPHRIWGLSRFQVSGKPPPPQFLQVVKWTRSLRSSVLFPQYHAGRGWPGSGGHTFWEPTHGRLVSVVPILSVVHTRYDPDWWCRVFPQSVDYLTYRGGFFFSKDQEGRWRDVYL